MTLEQMLRLDEVAVARKSDPATSHLAADSVSSAGVRASEDAVLNILHLTKHAMTAADVERMAAKIGYKWSAARMRTALPDLEKKGLVRRAGTIKRDGDRRRTLWALS